jgi:hypothetical protein
VQKGGYHEGAFGRRRPAGPSGRLSLDDGEKRTDVRIPLFRPSAISGTVLDEAGEPLVDVEVRSYRRTYSAGRAKFQLAQSHMTDDRGHFRLGRLLPGDYIVVVPMTQTSIPGGLTSEKMLMEKVAAARASELMSRGLVSEGAVSSIRASSLSGPALPPADDGKPMAYPTTFYPASGVAAMATIMSLESGEQRAGIDLQIRLVQVGGEDMTTDLDTATAFTDAGGNFLMPGVPTGQYVLSALQMPKGFIKINTDVGKGGELSNTIVSAESGDPVQWAALQIAVGDTDVTDVQVMLRPGLRVSGRLEFEGSAPVPTIDQLARLPVVIEQADGRFQSASTPPGRVDGAAKTFSSMGVIPGKYFVRLGSAPPGWTLKSITYQSRDVSTVPFELESSDASGIVITFTDQPTEILGAVRDTTGNPDENAAVLVFPADPLQWIDFGSNPRALKNVRVTAAGRFQANGLPAGDYLVVAVKDDAAVDWMNPAFLQAASRLATKVRVAHGESHSVELRTTDIK